MTASVMSEDASAVGVAQDDRFGAGFECGAHHQGRVFGVVAEAVEEVLAVDEHLAAVFAAGAHRVGDHLEVLFGVVRRACSTWRMSDLATRHSTGARESRSAW
ncbi:hypothetical protein GCM10029992_61660 [Glycomyces albus]